jgi:hypothetical protein
MIRGRGLRLFLTLVVGASCSCRSATSDAAPKPGETRMANMQDRVKKWAESTSRKGIDCEVQPWAEVPVEGIQFYLIDTRFNAYVVAVVGSEWPPVEKEAAMRAVLARGVKDPEHLAMLATAILEGRRQTIVEPSTELRGAAPEEAKLVHAPSLTGDTLEYWHRGTGMTRDLVRTRLNLKTMAAQRDQAADLVRAAMDPIDLARKQLAESDIATFPMAIDHIVALCNDKKDKRALQLLTDAVASHPNPDGRAAAAGGLVRCRSEATLDLLTKALHDAVPKVRKAAAEALIALGDAKARPALKQARDQEADLDAKGAMIRALQKLPE